MMAYAPFVILLIVLALGLGPAARGVALGLDPHRRQSKKQANSDMVRMLILLVVVFCLMFAWKLGGA
jgi:hypothetical protein